MKYCVIAQVWDSENEVSTMKPIGWFDRYVDASLFRDAYNNHYNANARIHDIMEAVFASDLEGGETK